MWAETLRGRGCSWLWWPFVGHKMIVLKLPITQYTWLQNILKYELNGQKKVQKCNSSGCLFVVITVLPTLMWQNTKDLSKKYSQIWKDCKYNVILWQRFKTPGFESAQFACICLFNCLRNLMTFQSGLMLGS